MKEISLISQITQGLLMTEFSKEVQKLKETFERGNFRKISAVDATKTQKSAKIRKPLGRRDLQ